MNLIFDPHDNSAQEQKKVAASKTRSASATDIYVTETNQKTGAEWDALLSLGFVFKQNLGTRLLRNEHAGPLYVQKPFYPEGDSCAHTYLLHPPAGVVSGDSLRIAVDLDKQAHALVTTPGAARFYRARIDQSEREPLSQKTLNHIRVADEACIEWLPCETIIFNGAVTELTTRFDLEGCATMIGWEVVCLGLPASNEPYTSGSLKQSLEINCNGLPIMLDRVQFSSGDGFQEQAISLDSNDIFGICVAGPYSDISEDSLDELVESLRELFDEKAYATNIGVTRLEKLIVVRYLGSATHEALAAFKLARTLLRPVLIGVQATEPRIWLT